MNASTLAKSRTDLMMTTTATDVLNSDAVLNLRRRTRDFVVDDKVDVLGFANAMLEGLPTVFRVAGLAGLDDSALHARMRDVVRVVAHIFEGYGNVTTTWGWFDSWPLREFHGATASEMVRRGRTSELLRYLEELRDECSCTPRPR